MPVTVAGQPWSASVDRSGSIEPSDVQELRLPRCRHDMEAAWCGDCTAAKVRRKGGASAARARNAAVTGTGATGRAPMPKKRGAGKRVATSPAASEAAASRPAGTSAAARRGRTGKVGTAKAVSMGKAAGRVQAAKAVRAPGDVTVRRVTASAAPTRPPRVSASALGSSAAASAVAKELQRRRRGLVDAENVLKKAQKKGVGLTAARERLAMAQQRLRDAERAAGRGAAARRPVVAGKSQAPLRVDELETLTDRGADAAPPHLDPDLWEGLVWRLRRGAAYHRRDCHVVEARDGAVALTRAAAQARGLTRCQVCSPLA